MPSINFYIIGDNNFGKKEKYEIRSFAFSLFCLLAG